jgi:hypothetical protein
MVDPIRQNKTETPAAVDMDPPLRSLGQADKKPPQVNEKPRQSDGAFR